MSYDLSLYGWSESGLCHMTYNPSYKVECLCHMTYKSVGWLRGWRGLLIETSFSIHS